MLPSGSGSGGQMPPRLPYATKSGVVHRKKCRHAKTPADLLRRFCLVCGCKAENYNFGVISCESCKAFFRRNAHKTTLGKAVGFGCSFRSGGCEVTLATRKKCPGCRLSKCFTVGMQAELIQKADQLPTSPPPPLQPQPPACKKADEEPATFATGLEHSEYLLRLWQQLQTPAASCQPSSFTEPEFNQAAAAADHGCTNILLVDFFDELRRLVADTMLCDISVVPSAPPGGGGGGASASSVSLTLLGAFVQQAAKFIAGLRQIDGLDGLHFVALLRRRLHSVLFPLSCAGYCQLDGKFYFVINGRRVACQPIEMFCDLVRQSSSSLVDYTALADIHGYTRHLLELTEMRPELLALFCAAKLLHLPPDCNIEDERLRKACDGLALRYHQHLVDSLYYHYPFDFDRKLNDCCALFKWSMEFDRTLENFIQYCPLAVDDGGEKLHH